MPCDVQSLLDDAKCFYALNPRTLAIATAQLWCNIAGSISPVNPPSTEFVLLNPDDGLWYEITDFELGSGDAIVDFGQTPVPASTQPYRVIVNVTDGLKYKFALETDPDGNITGGYDGTGPTLEAETPTVFIDASLREYELKFENDPDGNITFYLDQV